MMGVAFFIFYNFFIIIGPKLLSLYLIVFTIIYSITKIKTFVKVEISTYKNTTYKLCFYNYMIFLHDKNMYSHMLRIRKIAVLNSIIWLIDLKYDKYKVITKS